MVMRNDVTDCTGTHQQGDFTHLMTDRERAQMELKAIEPKIDFLHELLGIGLFAEVIQTSDGFWLGREIGDVGFNAFLGKPSKNALIRTREFIAKMTPVSQAYCKAVLAQYQLGQFC